MYLISAYFDEKTNNKIRQYILEVSKNSGNDFMIEGNVPPHITISAFETRQEEEVINNLREAAVDIQSGSIKWVTVGMFLPHVIYISPVLNEYLHELSIKINNSVKNIEGIKISPCYQPFSWIPHTTIAKKLTKDEIQTAFKVLQNQFGIIDGNIVKIGLAKTNPYEELISFAL